MAEPLVLLGFLALKAEYYAQFPSIRKMSDDWHQIALIAAANYNNAADLQRQLQQVRAESDAWEQGAGHLLAQLRRVQAERELAEVRR